MEVEELPMARALRVRTVLPRRESQDGASNMALSSGELSFSRNLLLTHRAQHGA